MNNDSVFSEESLRKIAEQKVSYRFTVKIHIVIFFVVNALLVLTNFLFSPEIYWFLFPLFSWLIGLSLHIIAYLLYARGVYPNAKRGVIYHAISYLSVMIFLFIINYFTLPDFYWVIVPAIFWGVAVIFHIIIYLQYFRKGIERSGKHKSIKERAIEKELEKMKKKEANNY
ncbi:MAG: 2TM domain-containing protein [Promethearchaeota archaeon]